MSIDRCNDCERLVDTDFDDEAYYLHDEVTGICRCSSCRDALYEQVLVRVKAPIGWLYKN